MPVYAFETHSQTYLYKGSYLEPFLIVYPQHTALMRDYKKLA